MDSILFLFFLDRIYRIGRILAFYLLNRLNNSPKAIEVSRLSSGKPGKNILKIL
jgi:hypothetical protein